MSPRYDAHEERPDANHEAPRDAKPGPNRATVRKALVTGAGGFIGRRLVDALAAGGTHVTALVRPGTAAQPRPASGGGGGDSGSVRRIELDLAEGDPTEALLAALEGVTHVFHLAARAHRGDARDPRASAEYARQNVHATERLALAAFAAGVERFVFVSTIKVHGEISGRLPIDAQAPYGPMDPYARSKMMAEIALQQLAATRAASYTILRPPLVYGPGVRANFLRLMVAIDRGMPLPLGLVRNRRSLVYVDNLVGLLQLAAVHPAADRAAFVAADAPARSTPELIRAIARHMERRPRLLPVPPILLRAAAGLVGRGDRVASLVDSLEADVSALEGSLGWRAPIGFDEAIARTVDWYTRSGRASD